MPAPDRIVLHAVSELYPIVKTGGLGDVAAALPAALRQLGCDARVVLPGYPRVLAASAELEPLWAEDDLFGGGPAQLLEARLEGVDVPAYVLGCPGLFDRPGGPYAGPDGVDFPDNHRRFAAFGWAAAQLLGRLGPCTVLHAHDWQAGLAVAYAQLRLPERHPSVMTIHNIDYPGAFPPEVFAELGLPAAAHDMHGVEFYGRVSFLKAGLYYADQITTVSPTYATEIQGSGQGGGFEGLLHTRRDRLTGILNGVDYGQWDPARDRLLPFRFDAERLEGKRRVKQALCDRLGLPGAMNGLLIGVVSRLVPPKGMDWLLACVPWLVDHGASLVAVGTGAREIEAGFGAMQERYPGRVAVMFRYDETLAHWVQGGSDCLAVPSRTEPCGLTQMYALRYGTLPIVRRTGGLADTVVDATPEAVASGAGTGFVFDEPDAAGLQRALARALVLHADRAAWRRVQKNAMRQDFGWERSARRYVELYAAMERTARSSEGWAQPRG
jgi:starch synthase